MEDHQAALGDLSKRFKNGASWFYWVAALSLINSLIGMFGGEWAFIFGLGGTQLVEGVALAAAQDAPESAGIIKAVAMVISIGILGAVAVVGWLSNKGITPVFLIGIVLYLLDGVLFLLVADWFAVGFHAFAAFQMISGFRALGQLKKLLPLQAAGMPAEGAPPVPPVVPEG